ncbi:hypothetical protein Tco_0025633 [Tanacetum coccineum]
MVHFLMRAIRVSIIRIYTSVKLDTLLAKGEPGPVLLSQRVDAPQNDSKGHGQENGNALLNMDSYHPVWGSMENNAAGREKRKQLLIMLCQHKAETSWL